MLKGHSHEESMARRSREFLAAVVNKGFVIGLLLMPAIFAALVVVMPRLMSTQGEQIRGEVAVIDPTGEIFDGLRAGIDARSDHQTSHGKRATCPRERARLRPRRGRRILR